MKFINSKLFEVCEFIIDCEHKTASLVEESNYISIRTPNIGRGYFILEGVNKVSKETYIQWTKRGIPQKDDLIMAREAPVGNVAIIKNEVNICLGQRTVLIRPNSTKVSPQYLCYLLISDLMQAQIQGESTGATVAHLNMSDIRYLQLPVLPNISIQQRIASILSAYDELIEVNNQRIKLLEETASQLYKEWFVRMRFPGYQKAKFEKGILEGWEVKELDFFGKIYTGKTPPTNVKEYYKGNIPFIKTPDMHGSIFISSTDETLSEKGSNTQKRSVLPKGSICVSCIGTGGIVSITTAEKSQTNQQINSLVPENSNFTEFLYYAISNLKETIELYGYTGATMTNLSKGKFEKLKILFPGKNLVTRYNEIVFPAFEQIQVLQQQNTHLRQIRDRLLPRLISGKLAVKEESKIGKVIPFPIVENLEMVAEERTSYETNKPNA